MKKKEPKIRVIYDKLLPNKWWYRNAEKLFYDEGSLQSFLTNADPTVIMNIRVRKFVRI